MTTSHRHYNQNVCRRNSFFLEIEIEKFVNFLSSDFHRDSRISTFFSSCFTSFSVFFLLGRFMKIIWFGEKKRRMDFLFTWQNSSFEEEDS